MAVRLKVQTTEVRLKVAAQDGAKFKAHEGIPIYPNPYSGTIDITPTEETQTLHTAGYMVHTDIVVEPIPSNYGLITWDGATITVS